MRCHSMRVSTVALAHSAVNRMLPSQNRMSSRWVNDCKLSSRSVAPVCISQPTNIAFVKFGEGVRNTTVPREHNSLWLYLLPANIDA